MKHLRNLLLCMLVGSLFTILLPGHKTYAAEQNVTIRHNENKSISLYVGDKLIIEPNPQDVSSPSSDESEDEWDEEAGNQNNENHNTNGNPSQTEDNRRENQNNTSNDNSNESTEEPEQSLETLTYEYICYDDYLLSLEGDNCFTAIAPGTTTIQVRGYGESGYTIFQADIRVTITYDMTNVTLSTDFVQGFAVASYYDGRAYYDSDSTFTINVNSPYILSGDSYEYDDSYGYSNGFSYTSSNPAVSVDASLYNNVITMEASANGNASTVVTFTIYGKSFPVTILLTRVGISKQSALLVKKKSMKLQLTGYDGPVEWTSTNPAIATVAPDGTVTGKKIGNVVIKAKVGNHYLGCAVSVTSSKIKNVVKRATYIGTHWKYSQAKRTQKGYYDCSALVWKAYKQYAHLTFGSPGYPSVALSEAKWCKSHKRMVKGGMTLKKVNKMQVNPGDLLFKSSDLKHPYRDIYHVEMFTGYYCNSVSDDGTPNISIKWAARGSYYMWEPGSLLGRPMK